MTKDADGIWSVTTEPLPADLYVYGFVVDGVVMADPANPFSKPISRAWESVVHVPGAAPELGDNDVPRRGAPALIADEDHRRRARVLCLHATEIRPVGRVDVPRALPLARRHATRRAAWTTVGRAHVILDNLIAAGYGETDADRNAVRLRFQTSPIEWRSNSVSPRPSGRSWTFSAVILSTN